MQRYYLNATVFQTAHNIIAASAIACFTLFTSGFPTFAQNLPIIAEPSSELTDTSPLEQHPGRLFSFETANQLSARALRLWIGTHQTNPDGPAGGTGNQIYHGGVDWGVTDRVQLGFSYQYLEDPTSYPINGAKPTIGFRTASLSAKYQVYDNGRFKVAAVAAAEFLTFQSDLFLSRNGLNANHLVPFLAVPVTYVVSPAVQLHFTPSVTMFPDSINGIPFYGTVASVGLGASWKPGQRWLAYGSINTPVGPGGNVISNTQAIVRTPIWTVGTRYNVTPKAAIDIYATNGLGATPATSILAYIPDGNTALVGVNLIYTPGRGPGYRPNYRGISAQPPSARNLQLQQDGFTLSSADTLMPGSVQGSLSYGGYGNYSAALIVSPDYDGQMEAIIEQYATDGSVAGGSTPNDFARYMLGAKLRFLDQNNGSPISLSVRALLGRDFSPSLTGVFYLGVPMSYKATPRIVVSVNPKLAAFGSTVTYGVGFGANYQVFDALQIIGEVTAVATGGRTVWASGLRYGRPNSPVSFDLFATNAIGRHGLGSLVAQSEPRIALSATYRLGLSRN